MALVLTDDESMLADSARGLFARSAPVTAFRALRDGAGALRYDPALWDEIAANGFIAPHLAEADHGLGMGVAAAGLIAEQAAHSLAGVPLHSSAMAATLIAHTASAGRKAQLLPDVIAGKLLIAPALEEGARHDPDRLATRARQDVGSWRIDGEKRGVADAVGAQHYLVSAVVDGAPALFLVAADAPGVAVTALDPVDNRNRGRIVFVAAPAERLGEGDAARAIAAALDLGRALLAAELLGLSDAAFDRTVAYLKQRVQFGRPIGSFQALQHRAARLYARLDAARGVVLKALRGIDEGAADATLLASLAKAVMTTLARDVMIEAVQMHGGIGVTDDLDIGFYVKRARVAGELLGDEHFHTERLASQRWGL